MKGSRKLRQAIFEVEKACYRAKCLVKSNLGSRPINSYWWIGGPNFGDWITPFLLEQYGFAPFHKGIAQSGVVGAGSIMQDIPPGYEGAVIGSGFIRDVGRREYKNARILALRGCLSRDLVANAPKDVVLGDPGILVSKYLPTNDHARTYMLGIVPHYKDAYNPILKELVSQAPGKVIIIDVRRSVRKVANEIAKCQHIISSSLHGLVLADAYSVPSAWVELSGAVIGSGFKFRDYYTSWDEQQDSIVLSANTRIDDILKSTRSLSRGIVKAKQDELSRAFESFKQYPEVASST